MELHFREILRDSLFVTLVAGPAYFLTAANGYIGGDHGIFAIVAAEGGYGHAPGYPLFSLLLQLLGWLPGDNWAHIASRATGLLGALAVGLIYAASRCWDASRQGSLIAAILYAFSTHVWFIHTQSEVFALNHLIVAGMLLLASPRMRTRWRPLLLGALFGLGASHHHTAVFMVPLGMIALWRDRVAVGTVRTLTGFGAGFFAGLLPLGWLVWVGTMHPERWHWGDPSTIDGFLRLFLRSDYGTFQVASEGVAHSPAEQIAFLASGWLDDFGVFGLLLALIGASLLLTRRGVRRTWSLGWALCAALAGPFFVALLTRSFDGVDFLLVRKFHMMFELLTVVALAIGATRFLEWLRVVWRAPAVAITLVACVVLNLPQVGIAHDRAVDQYCRDFLTTLPPDAIVFGSGDHNAICAEYLRRAEHLRIDVDYVEATLLVHDWYRRQAEKRLGIPVSVSGIRVDLLNAATEALRTGRPVFFTDAFAPGVLARIPSYPRGLAIRLVGSPSELPHPRDLAVENATVFEDFVFSPSPPEDPRYQAWRILVSERYAQTWLSIAGALAASGDEPGAAQARAMARIYELDERAPARE